MSDRLCVVCQRTELEPGEKQTCVGCLAKTRSAISEIVELYALLPAEMAGHAGSSGSVAGGIRSAETSMVGGDAMVLLGPGSDGASQWREIVATDVDATLAAPHAKDEYPGDVSSVLGELERWERDWRHTLRLAAATTPATVAGCAGFLTGHLVHMAQNPESAFDEFASDMRRMLSMLHRATRSGEHIEYGVPCLDCETQLVRRARDPRPCSHPPSRHAVDCDQGGLGDWCCPDRGCQRTRYSEADYVLALAEHWRKHGLESEAC